MALALPWGKFHWPDFQVLIHQFAELHLSDVLLDEYLKQGNKQHGIDLIQRNSVGEPGIAIQCKKTDRLSEGDLQALVQEFLDSDYRQSTTIFYLATTADLQSKKLNKWLEDKQRELKQLHNIGFIWWDIYYLERHLKAMWPLVARHFGTEAADDFCNPEMRINPSSKLKAVKDSIPRKIAPVTTIRTREAAIWFIPDANAVDINELFTKDRLRTRRICVIAEPYQGKSSYLQQSAFLLSLAGLRIQPIFIDVKKESVRPIETLLNEKYGAWKKIPLKDIVLIIDGLDEAPTARFLDLSRHINTFAEAHPNISIVTSCRGMFYHQYDLTTELPDFELHQLCPLDQTGINYYVQKRLGRRQATSFQLAVKKSELSSWLYHPFYLVNLVDEFGKNKILPDSKQKIIDEFIKKAFIKAGDRVLNSGDKLSSQSLHFRTVVEKLAICMQLLGKNSLSQDEFQQFFNNEETELLRHNSLISYHHHTWTFANAFLQEHLAASYLRDETFEEITGLITVGRQIRKIRTKWIQTLHSLLSLLPSKSTLFHDLVQFIENDSLELIFQTDPSIHSEEFRLKALEKLLKFCKENKMWPYIVPVEAIASFMRNVSDTIACLTAYIGDKGCPETTKILCCRILAKIGPAQEQEDGIFELVRSQLTATSNANYAGELVAILAEWELGDEEAVRTVMSINSHSNKHPFRNKMYEWITTLGFTNKFWEYGIQGIPILIAYNHPISQGGSEYPLETFFLTVHARWQLYALFKAMGTEEWMNFYRFKGSYKEGFICNLLQKCVQLYTVDPLIVLPISLFMQRAGHPWNSEHSEVNQFLEATQAHSLIVRCLGPAMFSSKAWGFGPLLTPASFDYLLWLFEDGKYEVTALQMPLMGISGKQSAVEEDYRKIVCAATGGKLFSLADVEAGRRMQQNAQKRLEIDLNAIQSVENFSQAVNRYFSLQRKKTLTREDLFTNEETTLSAAGSPFILSFLRDWIMPFNHDKATLENCLVFLGEQARFEYFRATEILEYHTHTEATDNTFRPLMRDYYYSRLPDCQFENTYWIQGNQYFQKNVEDLMGKIFNKYEFPTEPKYLTALIWLESGSIAQEDTPYHRKTGTLKDKIMQQLGKDGEHLLIDAVIANLTTGIRFEGVLGSHLALCRSLKITASKHLVLKILQQKAIDSYSLHRIVDLYLNLGGKKSALLPLLLASSYEEPIFDHLLETLADTYPEKVTAIGLAAIASGQLSEEEEFGIARLLTKMGRLEGFRYQVDLLRQKHFSLRLHSSVGLDKIDTVAALDMLRDIMYLTVDPAFSGIHPPENPKYVIHEWLSGLAGKGEEALLLVIDFLQEAETVLLPTYPEASDLKWYQVKLLEKFRGAEERHRTIPEILRFIEQVQNAAKSLPLPNSLAVE